jgi:hypothetical protein
LWEGVTSAKDPKIEEASSFIWMFWLQDWWREALSKYSPLSQEISRSRFHIKFVLFAVSAKYLLPPSLLSKNFLITKWVKVHTNKGDIERYYEFA